MTITKKNIMLKGYFQSENHFKHIREVIINDFTFPLVTDTRNTALKEEITATADSLSIHIRRGDYYAHDYYKNIFTSVNLNYYSNAIQKAKEKIGLSSLDVFLFTDDIPWAKAHFNFDSICGR